jgi:hypothetical protein
VRPIAHTCEKLIKITGTKMDTKDLIFQLSNIVSPPPFLFIGWVFFCFLLFYCFIILYIYFLILYCFSPFNMRSIHQPHTDCPPLYLLCSPRVALQRIYIHIILTSFIIPQVFFFFLRESEGRESILSFFFALFFKKFILFIYFSGKP